MNIYIYTKDFFKEKSEIQKAILQASKCLHAKIKNYEQQNISFSKIFNDDSVKYDKHGQFFTFKYRIATMQLRILYTYLQIDEHDVILIADYVIKKKNNKNYISRFDAINTLNPMAAYERSYYVASAS